MVNFTITVGIGFKYDVKATSRDQAIEKAREAWSKEYEKNDSIEEMIGDFDEWDLDIIKVEEK